MPSSRSHRPHCPGHDYHARGIYLITIVVSEAERARYSHGSCILGRLRCEADLAREKGQSLVELTDIGRIVLDCWQQIPVIQARRGVRVRLLEAVVMPDHFHGVLFVEEDSPVSIGQMIWGMKVGCTKAYRAAKYSGNGNGSNNTTDIPTSVDPVSSIPAVSAPAVFGGASPDTTALVSLFNPDYDDTILCHRGQLQAMLDYVRDNPRRAILRRLYPDFYQRRLHIRIESTDPHGQPVSREYAAFGNLFLLRYPKKEQVMCHRWRMQGIRRDYTTPYIATPAYQEQHDTLLQAAREGAVLVTPAISAGEKSIMNDCLAEGFPVIHLQQEPVNAYWKPEHTRFEACLSGQLLILSPWHIDSLAPRERQVDEHTTLTIAANTSYSRFHNLNDLAAEICRGITTARFSLSD